MGIDKAAGISADGAQRREMFAYFGVALYRAQCVEKQLGILSATTFNPGFLKATSEERDLAFDTELSKTIGKLIKSLKAISVPPALEGRLTRSLRLRNWLAHDYFWQRATDMLSSDGRALMISELAEASQYLESVDTELTAIAEDWLIHAGISREKIDAEYESLLRDSRTP